MGRPACTERNAEIVRLRREGVEPRDIAKRLNLTRKTVIGVCFRAGLNNPAAPSSAGRGADYDPAFRAAVVEAALGGNVAAAARAWGVGNSTVWGWIYQRRAA